MNENPFRRLRPHVPRRQFRFGRAGSNQDGLPPSLLHGCHLRGDGRSLLRNHLIRTERAGRVRRRRPTITVFNPSVDSIRLVKRDVFALGNILLTELAEIALFSGVP